MRNYFWGLLLITFGVLFLLDNLGIASFGDIIGRFWPMIIIFWGVSILVGRDSRRRDREYWKAQVNIAPPYVSAPPPPPGPGSQPSSPPPSMGFSDKFRGDQSDLVHYSDIMGDLDLTLSSANFKGGSISTIFGDQRIDLSRVTVAEGNFELRIHSVFGDCSIMLPSGAAISLSSQSTFGDSSIMGQTKGGFSSSSFYVTPNFESSTRRLKITLSKVFGDLRVV
jgi:predicted membrane protein